VIFALVAYTAPVVEPVRLWRFIDFMCKRIARSESRTLVRADSHRGSVSGGVALTLPHRHQCDVAVRRNIEAVFAGFLQCEREVRRIDLVDLSAVEFSYSEVQHALVQLQLDSVVADIRQREAGLVIDPQGCCAYVEFRARVFVGPDIVGSRERPVKRSAHPVLGAAWLHGDRARHVLQASHTARRIIVRRSHHGEQGNY
jgi:hypothetical protein